MKSELSPPVESFSSGLDKDLGLKSVASLLPSSSSNPANVTSKIDSVVTNSIDEFDSDEEITDEELDRYLKRVSESQNFDVPEFSGYLLDAVESFELERPSSFKLAKDFALMAKDHWNNDNNNVKIEFVDIVQATGKLGLIEYYFITFRAKDEHNGKKNFEAKIVTKEGRDYVEFVRFQRDYPNAVGRDDLDSEDSPSPSM